MKVIGVIGNATSSTPGKYLVEATGDELAKLMNKSHQCRPYEEDRKREFPGFYTGTEVKIDKYWDQLRAAEKVQGELKRSAAIIRGLADAVDAVGVPDLKKVDCATG